MSNKPKVYFDACCFIDLATDTLKLPAENGRAGHIYFCRKFLDASRAGDATVYTSILTIMECSYVPDRSNGAKSQIETDEVKNLFKGMLMSGRSGVMPVQSTPSIVVSARSLRWDKGITCKAMDSVHLATALSAGCSHFLTTDNIGEENIKRLGSIGLIVCSADKVSSLLPDRYTQGVLNLPNGGKHAGQQPTTPAA